VFFVHILISLSLSLSYSKIGHVFSYQAFVTAINPSFFQTTISEPNFLHVSQYSQPASIVDYLYTAEGSSAIVIGETFSALMGVTEGQHLLVTATAAQSTADDEDTQQQQQQQQQQRPQMNVAPEKLFRLRAGAFLSLAPAFQFSKFPQLTRQDSLVSMPSLVRMAQGVIGSVEELPMQRFLLQFVDGVTEAQKDTVKAELERMTRLVIGVGVWDYRDSSKSLQQASDILGYFFNFATAVAMLVCFFSLSSSMYTNIFEQTKEIGVLRAIGLTKLALYRIYIYEAICLILASSIAGVAIGSFVSYTMTMQRILFTQLPIPFVMPYDILLVVGVCSIVFALAGSWGPISFLLRQRIVTILRFMF
jgi:hypothetical protein